MEMSGTAIAAGVAFMLFLTHIISVTWFLRGIKSRNDLVVQSVHDLGQELRSDIGRLDMAIQRLGFKIDKVMKKVGELSVEVAVVKHRIESIEKEGSGGKGEVREA